MPNTTRKPAKDFRDITQLGHKALLLAKRDRERIEGRLSTGRIDGLESDLTALGDDRVSVKTTLTDGQRATATQDAKAAQALTLIGALRQNFIRRRAPKDVRISFGINRKINANSITSIVAAGQNILNGAREDAVTARQYGLLDSDLVCVEVTILELREADDRQEAIIAAKPLTTAQRNRRARNIQDAVREISGAGSVEFAFEPQVRAEYEALIKVGGKTRKSRHTEAPPPAAQPTPPMTQEDQLPQ